MAYRPWELRIAPFRVAPQTWYVSGQTWAGCYLIDTGEGLILIDTAIAESLYLLVDSVYRLGYRMEDIKKIFISHAHFDYCGGAAAMKELTGAELYMSKEDYEFMKACPEETTIMDRDSHAQMFEPDAFFSDDEPVVLGNVKVRTMLTPDLRERFFTDAEKLKNIHVDIALPSHPNQIEIVTASIPAARVMTAYGG